MTCKHPKASQEQKAQLRDYWQFSRNIQSESNCRRSGINITKDEFRLLGQRLTTYVASKNKTIYTKVKASMGLNNEADNLFESLSYFLISSRTPDQFGEAKVADITAAWVNMLEFIRQNADAITAAIEQSEAK